MALLAKKTRIGLFILALLASVTVLNVGESAAQQAKVQLGCLEYEDSLGVRGMWNLDTNQVNGPVLDGDKQNPVPEEFWRSPDGLNDAYTVAATGSTTLEVLSVKPTRVFTPRIVAAGILGPMDARNLVWSPNSKSFAFVWRSADNKWFLSAFTADGRVSKTITLAAKSPDDVVALHGWSSDSKFLAYSLGDPEASGTGWYQINIVSMPDLKTVRTFTQRDGLPARSKAPADDAVLWSKSSLWLAYFSGVVGKSLTLNLYAPDSNTLQNFSVAAIPTDSYKLLWSPDGQVAALLTLKNVAVGSGATWRADVFAVDSKVYLAVADKIMNVLPLGGASVVAPAVTWSPDGKALIVARQMTPPKPDRADLYAWTTADQQLVRLAQEILLNFNVTADGRYLLVKSVAADAKQTLVMDLQNLTRLAFPELAPSQTEQVWANWSPDSGWLLISEDNVLTWAIKPDAGIRRQIFDPDIKTVLWSTRTTDNHAVAFLYTGSGGVPTLRLYISGNRRDVPLSWLPKGTKVEPTALVISPNNQIMGVVPYGLFQEDGKLLKKLPTFKANFHNFALTTCGPSASK